MDSTNKPDTYLVGGSGLPTTPVKSYPQNYTPREFQHNAFNWIHNDNTAPIAAVTAPTGAGKTDIITNLAHTATQALCIYPTNALINEQQAILENSTHNLTTKKLTGDTLTGSGHTRTENLLNIIKKGQITNRDVLITNPDILQAAIQNKYYSTGDKELELFAQFDAIIYDEFHAYNTLAATGLLTQIKLLTERGAYRTKQGTQKPPNILLTSATPSTTLTKHIETELELDTTHITSTLHPLDIPPQDTTQTLPTTAYNHASHKKPRSSNSPPNTNDAHPQQLLQQITTPSSTGVSRFRYPMVVQRHSDDITDTDTFDVIAEQLHNTINTHYTQDTGPIAAVVFNSARRSNEFHTYFHENYDDSITQHIVKDNGYDTNVDSTRDISDGAVLNTTRKGELGLDFDIKRLVMVAPPTASQFIQRIGRAARQSPAIVDVFGLNDPMWPQKMSYGEFLQHVIQTLIDTDHVETLLREVTGMRVAAAVQDRVDNNVNIDPGALDNFKGFHSDARWKQFFMSLDKSVEKCGDVSDDVWNSLGNNFHPSQSLQDLLSGLTSIRDGLDSLRGGSISATVSYTDGVSQSVTEYSLIRALRHYELRDVRERKSGEDNLFVLGDPRDSGSVTGVFVGEPFAGDGIDLLQSKSDVESQLQLGYKQLARTADLSTIPINKNETLRFLELAPLSTALTPRVVYADEWEINCDETYGTVKNAVQL